MFDWFFVNRLQTTEPEAKEKMKARAKSIKETNKTIEEKIGRHPEWGAIPLIATGVGISKHKELYRLANKGAFTDGRPYLIYDKNAIYFGCHLEHYKWDWKQNKAVRL